MRDPPTDRCILQKIHDHYISQFGDFDKDAPELPRSSKIYVSIDCKLVASELGVDPDIIFGRLYYHLNRKYGYTQDDGSKVELFAIKVGGDRHAINFPLLSAILADLNQSWFRFTVPLAVSFIAIVISIIALCNGS